MPPLKAEEPSGVTEICPAAVIILAAGEGRRMKSRTPKVLHMLGGRSMLGHVLDSAAGLNPGQLIVVVGQGRELVTAHLAERAPGARVVVQPRQEGTGNAVRIALEAVGQIHGVVVVTYGDTPLLRSRTLAELVAAHRQQGNAVTALTAKVPDPAGYGRIVLDSDGEFSEIVEETDATPEQRAIDEINSGVYAFDGDLLADAVKRVATDNAKGEEYLTDVIAILRADGHRAGFVRAADAIEVEGVNDRVQLAKARRLYNDRVLAGWMLAGVTIFDPATTWIDADVRLEADVEIGPGSQLQGRTTIKAGARVGPGCLLADTTVAWNATVTHSVCVSARIGPGAQVGPFADLRPGSEVPGNEGVQST
jgi:bifunctional UDP-N-acetylglucosamine pyrophosphorylase/glucosamine-1-phosphate N-acetyltransferase